MLFSCCCFYGGNLWLEAEIEFLDASLKLKPLEETNVIASETSNGIEYSTFKEMLLILKTSKMALRKRMAEGLPFYKLGNELRFNPKLVNDWLVAQN